MTHKICQGDIIALHGGMPGFVDNNDQRQAGIGYLSTPPLSEPIPEREEKISHLRSHAHSFVFTFYTNMVSNFWLLVM